MKSASAPGNTLTNYFCIFIDENAHYLFLFYV